ncbi:MAG: hypothetical protein MZV70_43140 [Desulfobacterales bacterium]|nr:hypothetical protein [Desulfobacterales bacterium]
MHTSTTASTSHKSTDPDSTRPGAPVAGSRERVTRPATSESRAARTTLRCRMIRPAVTADPRGAAGTAALRSPPDARVVLEAPPGAGKSTVVPLALLDAAVARRRPHRDARAAPASPRAPWRERMAALLGERTGRARRLPHPARDPRRPRDPRSRSSPRAS